MKLIEMLDSSFVLNSDPVPERLASNAKQQWQRPSAQRWVNQLQAPR
jgi:glutathione S-transferase